MEQFILENETAIRIGCFFSILLIMGTWELYAPKKVPTISKAYRWINNLGLIFFNSLVVKLLLPFLATGVAIIANENHWGLLNYYKIDGILNIIIFVVVMDFIIYLQHVMVHAIPLLWRFHRAHHADLDYDTTTGARIHTIEILLSLWVKFTAIILLGPSVVAVIIFEVLLNAMAMFSHGNVGLPKSLDTLLRYVIVTPDMHRIHHSVIRNELNSNFGVNLSIWDKIFGTYKKEPKNGQDGLVIGIEDIRDKKKTNFILGMLSIPFMKKNEKYFINASENKE